jgi:hypothetical protein
MKGSCGHDPFFIRRYNATEAIAISEALDDDGLFELNFRDERYLPFEFCGAVSKWRIELPPENNAFDFDSLTDFIMKLSFTSREGGPELGKIKSALVRDRLPGNGLRYFDIRHEFPDAWPVFAGQHKSRRAKDKCEPEHEKPKRIFDLKFTRNMFPFLTCSREVVVKRIHIFIMTTHHCGDHIRLEYIPARKHRCCDTHARDKEVICRLQTTCCESEKKNGGCRDSSCEDGEENWTKGCNHAKGKRCCCATVFHGIVDVHIGPLDLRAREIARPSVDKLRLPSGLDGITEAYLICEYAALEKGEKGLCCGNERSERLGMC